MYWYKPEQGGISSYLLTKVIKGTLPRMHWKIQKRPQPLLPRIELARLRSVTSKSAQQTILFGFRPSRHEYLSTFSF
uniref:Uncharacterized protein n=1 Tax=Picea glauca TaxID=3330 RepID=A0A117NFX0_PICGL|nr:hypothetical protein ABT39_MTgene2242 [Picea glauca]QHR86628.1 hypothetical protein Q903MT_gene631 [Picea sitchensis]